MSESLKGLIPEIMEGNKRGEACCPHCGWYTKSEMDYKLHLANNHKGLEDDGMVFWECRMCRERYAQLETYVTHLEVLEGFCKWDQPKPKQKKYRRLLPKQREVNKPKSEDREELDDFMDELMEDIEMRKQIDDDEDEVVYDSEDDEDDVIWTKKDEETRKKWEEEEEEEKQKRKDSKEIDKVHTMMSKGKEPEKEHPLNAAGTINENLWAINGLEPKKEQAANTAETIDENFWRIVDYLKRQG